jgi:2-amino-4-hydroxy-6-hydroxymethyldihydropteridine diphosphokinase
MNKLFLQLGSNLGDREQLIKDAIKFINEKLGKVLSYSKIYESDPWRVDGQKNYLNQILEAHSLLSAEDSLRVLQDIENELGRVRLEKWGERLIDIDIIFFNNDIIETSDLCVPHKHMHERNFVLIPLNEIAPQYVHPKYNKTVADLLEESKDTENVVEYAI